MQLNITARHLKLTPAITDYVQKKLEKAPRYFDHLIWGQVILSVEKNRHTAEIVIHAKGRTFRAQETSIDLYAAIDLASDKIDEQLRRYKDRRRRLHRGGRRTRRDQQIWDAAGSVVESMVVPRDYHLSSVKTLRLSDLSIGEAIAAMEQSESAHWIFRNKDTQRVSVVYRKPDKTYGVVESIGAYREEKS